MGFFALRKVDLSPISLSHGDVSPSGHSDKSVAQLIRARFGRKKRQANLSKTSFATDAPSASSSNHLSSRTLPHYTQGNNDTERRSSHQGTRRTSCDVATVTLAHKLNELAAAHKEGLLNDDDYRVLRQNLFNTFATHSAPPVEAPVVKSVEPIALQLPSGSQSDRLTAKSVRAPSLLTQTTNRSSVSTLFRRLRRRTSYDQGLEEQDRISVFSSGSRVPISPTLNSNARELGRQRSSSSLTTRSRHIPLDLRSVSSKQSIRSAATASDIGGMSRGSTRSLRGNEPPPSSFNLKHLSSRLLSFDGNADRLQSAADIRGAIRAVEAEQQTVVTSFSLYPRQQLESVGGATSSHSRSMVSRTLSSQHVAGSGKNMTSNRSVSDPGSIVFPTPDERWLVSQDFSILDVDNCPAKMSQDARLYELERRRTEINMRYQQRLDYLRARLKGAEIHERLLRK